MCLAFFFLECAMAVPNIRIGEQTVRMKQTIERIYSCFLKEKNLPMPTVYEVTDSTNLRARNLAEQGAAHGTAVIALTQTAGRGRLARRFESDIGGLYMSVVLRHIPLNFATRLTPYAAVCAARTVESLCNGVTVGVKWVNDLYIEGKKLAGILTESVLAEDGKGLDYAIVGIGINLTNNLHGDLASIAVSLDRITVPPDIGTLAARITKALIDAGREIEDGTFLREYSDRCFLLGSRVTVYAEQIYEATALSIGDDASLTVMLDSGEKRILSSGEVSVRI